jgi:hypothetical protein
VARKFRLWEKKRGSRRTGSRLVGAIGEGTFFFGLLLIGFLVLIALVTSQLVPIPGAPRYEAGSGLWLGVVVTTSFILIGAGGLLFTLLQVGTSAERRTALAQKAKELDPRTERQIAHKEYPTVPQQDSLFLSPGTVLRYRLPLTVSPAWEVVASMLYALLWNGLFTAMAVLALQGFQGEQPRLTATALLFPLGYMAVRTTHRFLIRLVETTSIGPTSAEVSDLPLRPGCEYELCLIQVGRGKVKSLETRLVCEEEATFCQGTNVRTERRRVHDERLFRLKELAVKPEEPLSYVSDFAVPINAMHSVQMTNNAIQWRLIVQGRMQRGTSFRRSFPLVVYPCTQHKTHKDRAAHQHSAVWS